jgi:hypothetical protein
VAGGSASGDSLGWRRDFGNVVPESRARGCFDVMRVQPAIGRFFSGAERDDAPSNLLRREDIGQ